MGELGRYTSVGLVSTVAYLALYLLLRNALGVYGANAVALALCTVGNTVAQVRFTFVLSTALRVRRAVTAGLVSFASGVALTSVGLGVGQLIGATSPAAEATAILIGTGAAALVKFVLLQAWVFRSYNRSAALSSADTITAIAA